MNESAPSLCYQLRRMADRAGDAIDAERLCRAADEIERLRAALVTTQRERDDLQSFCKGMAININNMLRPVGAAQKEGE